MRQNNKLSYFSITMLLECSVLLVFASTVSSTELPFVQDVLRTTPYSAKHTQQVLAGKIAATDIVPVSEKELAQGVACLVKKDTLSNLDALGVGTWLAPEQHIISSALIPDNASIDDFSHVHFAAQNQQEIQRFIDAEAGDILNLSSQEISQFNQLQALQDRQSKNLAVEQQIQTLLLQRYQQYRKKGAAGVAPYARSGHKQSSPGQQLITSLGESHGFKQLHPNLYALLKQYPQANNMALSESFYWYMVNLGDRPAIGLSHRLHLGIDAATFMVERGYYISHTLDSVQILVGLVPVQEGILLVYINRSWTEKISGLFSSVKRAIAHKIMISEMEHVMEKIQVCGKQD